jgi:hypothetical protein
VSNGSSFKDNRIASWSAKWVLTRESSLDRLSARASSSASLSTPHISAFLLRAASSVKKYPLPHPISSARPAPRPPQRSRTSRLTAFCHGPLECSASPLTVAVFLYNQRYSSLSITIAPLSPGAVPIIRISGRITLPGISSMKNHNTHQTLQRPLSCKILSSVGTFPPASGPSRNSRAY